MGRGRYHQIDFLRALACGMVVVFHYAYRGQLDGWVPFPGPDWLVPIAKFGYMGVQLFFAISGFVIILSAENATPRRFVASRAARLFPAFWAAIVLTTVAVHVGHVPSLLVPWRDVAINFTMLAPWFKAEYVDSAYWSLLVELHFYVYVWVLIRLGWMKHIQAVMAGWLALSIVNFARPMFPVEFLFDARWAPFFCIGICAYLIHKGRRTPFVYALFAVAALLAAAYSRGQALKMASFSPAEVGVVTGITLSIAAVFWLVAHGRFQLRGHPVLYWAATLTYPIYLLHEYIGYVALTDLWHAGVPAGASLLLTVAGVLLLSYLVHRWVEQPLSGRIRQAVAGA